MSYVELYSKDILDTINLGKSKVDFDESMGDYIKVELYREDSDSVLGIFYSNKLLLKYSETDDYYLEDYHFHPENPEMGFCSGKKHTNQSMTNLKPITVGKSLDEPLNIDTKYRKQIQIFRDDKNEIYIKPNEIIKLLKLGKDKYRLKIYFLRNIKSSLAVFLKNNKNNLIENGNFFAGLEATQTGDLDRSVGRNNFRMMDNPGKGKFVLEQDGLFGNVYDMRVTGIESGAYYIFSFMVSWNGSFNGSYELGYFSPSGPTQFKSSEFITLPYQPQTNAFGSWIVDDEGNDVFSLYNKKIGNLTWYKRFFSVFADPTYIKDGTIRIYLGSLGTPSTNPFGRRYFTDLKLEKVNPSDIDAYLQNIKNTGN